MIGDSRCVKRGCTVLLSVRTVPSSSMMGHVISPAQEAKPSKVVSVKVPLISSRPLLEVTVASHFQPRSFETNPAGVNGVTTNPPGAVFDAVIFGKMYSEG